MRYSLWWILISWSPANNRLCNCETRIFGDKLMMVIFLLLHNLFIFLYFYFWKKKRRKKLNKVDDLKIRTFSPPLTLQIFQTAKVKLNRIKRKGVKFFLQHQLTIFSFERVKSLIRRLLKHYSHWIFHGIEFSKLENNNKRSYIKNS